MKHRIVNVGMWYNKNGKGRGDCGARRCGRSFVTALIGGLITLNHIRHMINKAIMTLGVAFAALGVLGFAPGVTTDGMLLGFFAVDATHNIIHILTGALAIFFARQSEENARMFAKAAGVVYAAIAVVGLFWSGDMLLGLVSVNLADDFLHVIAALVFLWLGFGAREEGVSSPPAV